jgi:uncharacterized membrane protein
MAVSYPVVAHLAVTRGSGPLALVSTGVLLALILWPSLLARKVLAWLAVPALAAGLVLLARINVPWLPLYLPPVLINFALAWLFGQTLLSQETPLIERLVRLLHAPEESIDPAIVRYARRLTLAWTVLFCVMGALNLVLALCAVPSGVLVLMGVDPPVHVSLETWSLFTNLLNYLVAGGFFVAEYAYRSYRFPRQPYRNFLDFVRRSAAVGSLAVRPRRL